MYLQNELKWIFEEIMLTMFILYTVLNYCSYNRSSVSEDPELADFDSNPERHRL